MLIIMYIIYKLRLRINDVQKVCDVTQHLYVSYTYKLLWEIDEMAEIVEYIPELKDVDAEIFHKNLNRDLTSKEIIEVRKWALGSESMLE